MKFLFFVVFFFFFQCSNFFYNDSFGVFFKERIEQKKKIKILLTSEKSKIIKDESKDIPYPYQDFVSDTYVDSLKKIINSHSLLELGELKELKNLNFKEKKIILENGDLDETIFQKILTDNDYDLYAKINISYSIWQQKVIGEIAIFNSKEKVFAYKINQQSKEIILDKDSPYGENINDEKEEKIEIDPQSKEVILSEGLSYQGENDFFYLPRDKNKTHAEEIIRIFEKMGMQCGNEIIKILERKKK